MHKRYKISRYAEMHPEGQRVVEEWRNAFDVKDRLYKTVVTIGRRERGPDGRILERTESVVINIKARTVEEAFENFEKSVNKAIEEQVRIKKLEEQERRRAAASAIVGPDGSPIC